jgi:hypothetical protein
MKDSPEGRDYFILACWLYTVTADADALALVWIWSRKEGKE